MGNLHVNYSVVVVVVLRSGRVVVALLFTPLQYGIYRRDLALASIRTLVALSLPLSLSLSLAAL